VNFILALFNLWPGLPLDGGVSTGLGVLIGWGFTEPPGRPSRGGKILAVLLGGLACGAFSLI